MVVESWCASLQTYDPAGYHCSMGELLQQKKHTHELKELQLLSRLFFLQEGRKRKQSIITLVMFLTLQMQQLSRVGFLLVYMSCFKNNLK